MGGAPGPGASRYPGTEVAAKVRGKRIEDRHQNRRV